jgi:hypothetical protein
VPKKSSTRTSSDQGLLDATRGKGLAVNAIVFRTDHGKTPPNRFRSKDQAAIRLDYLRKELDQGRLRQGWGYLGCGLLKDGLMVTEEDWIPAYVEGFNKSWGDMPSEEDAKRRLKILSPMVLLQAGDLVVVPNIHGMGKLTVLAVSGKYKFSPEPVQRIEPNHICYGHLIPVDNRAVVTLDRRSSSDSEFLASKLRGYQKAVNLVADPATRECIVRLFQKHAP